MPCLTLKNYFSGQLWKLNGTKLFNKANLWNSTDEWNLRAEGKMVYVENTSKNKFLGTFDDVFHDKTLLLNSVGQMWKMGIATNEGYFTLLDPNSQKVLTASSSHCLEMLKCLFKLTFLSSRLFFLNHIFVLLIELDDLKIILYWHTPYDQNLFENSFGIGFYEGELKTGSELLERTQCLPNSITEGLKFKKQLAKDGPLSVDIDGN